MKSDNNAVNMDSRLVFAVEMESGATTFYSDMETLGRLMVIYEECGYSCLPYLYEEDRGGETCFGMSAFKVDERASEFTELNKLLAMPSGVPIQVWAWGLVVEFSLPDWEFAHMDRSAKASTFLGLMDTDEDTVTFFGQPEMLKTAVHISRRRQATLQNMSRKDDEYVSITLSYSDAADISQDLEEAGYEMFWREAPRYTGSDDDITLQW